MDNALSILEGLIFLSGEEGLTIAQIEYAMNGIDQKDILELIDKLKEQYKDRGIELVEFADRYKFVTKEFVYPYGKKLFEQIKPSSLSQAALETLAVVAYKQPVTRVEIEDIRGVNCEVMLKKLVARGLLEANERLDAVGKPLLYCVTDEFLDAFGLETLKELPELPKQNALKEDLFEE